MGEQHATSIACKNFETFAKADARRDKLIIGDVLNPEGDIIFHTLASNDEKTPLKNPSYLFHQNFSAKMKQLKLPNKDKSAIQAAVSLTSFIAFSAGLSIIFYGVSKLLGSDYSLLQTSATLTGYFLLVTKHSGIKDIKALYSSGKMYLDGRKVIKKSAAYTP